MTARETLRPLMAAFIAIDVAIVVARIYVRARLATLGYDDYAIILALVGFIIMSACCYVSLDYGFGATAQPPMMAAKWFVVTQITYIASFPIVRISVALVLHRIVQGMPRTQRLLVASMVFVGVYALACIIVDVVHCIPLKAAWGDGTGRCLTPAQMADFGFAVSAMDISSAVFYAILPVFLLKGLQMNRRTKIAIMFLLGLGAGTAIISIIRLRTIILIMNSQDMAASLNLQLESFIYSFLEFALSIFTASLVAFRPLVKYLPFGSSARTSGKQGLSGGNGGLGGSGTNDFKLSRRPGGYTANAFRLDNDDTNDDAESQRDILQDGKAGVWKRSEITVQYESSDSSGKQRQKSKALDI